MRAVLFEPRHGEVVVEHVPPPKPCPGRVQVFNAFSLVSAGTERPRLRVGRHGLAHTARERPGPGREVVRAVRERGAVERLRLVSDRSTSTRMLLGCSSAGLAVAVHPPGPDDVAVGALVAAGGGGYAAHAELVSVPANLCVPLPRGVSSRDAAFATVGANALHAIHQAHMQPGSRVAVIGLDLVGQLAVRMLRAYSFDVIGIDRDPAMVDMARRGGVAAVVCDDRAEGRVRHLWKGAGADAILVVAATPSAGPVALAGALARDRATVVMVGDVPVASASSTYYGKELTLRYARSYGRERYDPQYEEHAGQYPEGDLPWPQRRNMAEFLRLVAGGIDLNSLAPIVFPLEEAPAAYDLLRAEGPDRPVAVLLSYGPPGGPPAHGRITIAPLVVSEGAR